jgi:Ca-activated chloride channel family protein
MNRTYVLIAVAIGGVAAALLLPRVSKRPFTAGPNVAVTAPPLLAATSTGALTIHARPARHAILSSGDDIDVVYEISAATVQNEQRLPVDFALVFDRSGSMTGAPLEKAKAAAGSLIDRLSPRDRLAIVHFGSEAQLALTATAMDDSGKEIARRVVSEIQADGSTNMSAALTEAQAALTRAGAREGAVRRIVLLSDGEANAGILGPGLIQLVRNLSAAKLRVSALGLGIEFNEDTMLAIADAGAGQYRYLRNADEVASALGQELSQAGSTAASSVSLVVSPGDGVEVRDVLGYEVTHDGNTTRLGLSDLASGETRRVVVRVHSSAGAAGQRTLLDARLAYEDVRADHQARSTQALAAVEATTDATKIAGSYDTDAAKTGLRARWGGSLVRAMHSYDQNDVAGASKGLDNSYADIQAEATALGDGQLALEMSEKKHEAQRVMLAAPASSPVGLAAKKSLKSFGVAAER